MVERDDRVLHDIAALVLRTLLRLFHLFRFSIRDECRKLRLGSFPMSFTEHLVSSARSR